MCKEHAPRAAVLPVTPVADNRVSASERTATTVQACRSVSMFSAASLAIWMDMIMDVHICAPFQLRSVPTLQLQGDSDLAIFAYLRLPDGPDPTNIPRKIEVCDHAQSDKVVPCHSVSRPY